MRRRLLLGIGLAALAAGRGRPAESRAPVIAAASDLQFALDEVAARFARETGQRVRLAYGSTGNFARQIRAGAPFELFLAADESYIAALHAEGLTRDAGQLYALGRIVIVAAPGSPLEPDGELDGLARLLAEGRLTRFAIANPEHAPYGMRAREALEHRGLWAAVRPALVLGENVAQAARFALSGNAEGGIIAYSLVLAPDLAGRARHALIPAGWHSPLRQRMALLRNAGPVAEAFHAYMQSEGARAIMRRYGFALPGE